MTRNKEGIVVLASILAGIVVGAALTIALVAYHEPLWWWVEVHTGSANQNTPYYGFFSGVGTILIPPVLTVNGLMLAHWWQNRCHEPYCPRLGRHKVEGTPYHACRKHHPELTGLGEAVKGHMSAAYDLAKKITPGVDES